MILIVTNKIDVHSDFIIRKLHEEGLPFLRLNTEDFPQKVTLFLEKTRTKKSLLVETPAGIVSLRSIKSVWYRRPEDPLVSDEIKDIPLRSLAFSETKTALHWLWGFIREVFWVNHPNFNRIAGNKIYQSEIAADLGIRVPDYIITNNPLEAEKFILNYGSVAIKPIGGGIIRREDGYHLIYTNRISEINRDELDFIRYAPVYLQEYVFKKHEIRATVVGSRVFACKIDSQKSNRTKDDWRRYDHEKVGYTPCVLPPQINRFCCELVDVLGLNFGAIDLIVTPDDDYVFLEINPNGQWLWIEEFSGLPISSALIQMLNQGRR